MLTLLDQFYKLEAYNYIEAVLAKLIVHLLCHSGAPAELAFQVHYTHAHHVEVAVMECRGFIHALWSGLAVGLPLP